MPLDDLRQALAERYRLERELGAGGMATVYLADDLKHHRKVAVKVLWPDLARMLGPERFLREIRLAAQLTHPHILALLDSGESAGWFYYVMPFVEGESLRQRLAREGPLPVAEAVQIAIEVADALNHAHQKGIVHRDVKPENVLLSGGHAVVVDFGIARPPVAEATKLTETGLLVGTPQYMSPEQMLGDAEVDGRSDLYSLGCLLYEMLTGSPPFTGPTLQAVIARQLGTPPPRVSAFRAGIPASIEEALVQALAPNVEDRHPSMAGFAAALRPSDGGVPARGTANGSAPGRTPFVGRAKERAELTAALERLGERSVDVELDVAVGPDGQERKRVELLSQVLQQEQRALVRPVQIVEQGHDRLRPGSALDELPIAPEEMLPLLLGWELEPAGTRPHHFDRGEVHHGGDLRPRRSADAAVPHRPHGGGAAVSGVETLAAIREVDPGLRSVLVSGYHESDIPPGLGEGANRFRQKPYAHAELIEVVAKVLAMPVRVASGQPR